MSKQNMIEKKPLHATTVINNEFSAIFALVNRLTTSLDSSINGKDRSVLINELSQLNFDNLSEVEKNLAIELTKRTIMTLERPLILTL